MGSPKWEKADWIRNGPGLILMVLCIIFLPEFLRSADWEFIVLILVLATIKIKDWIKYKENPFVDRYPVWSILILIAFAIVHGFKIFG